MTVLTVLAAVSIMAVAAPVAAQSMDHSNMPGMKMPPTKPAPKRPAAKQTAAPTRAQTREEGEATDPEQRVGGAQDPAPASADPDCPPEHAAMGHCTPKASGTPDTGATAGAAAMPGVNMGTGGTALPAGDAPAPAAPEPSYADRIWGREAMAPTRAALRSEHGGGSFSQIMIDIAELQIRDGREGYRWEGESWFGGDIDRLVVKTEGEGSFGDAVDDAEAQALYSRAIGPYFNLQAGVRQDFAPAGRTYAAFGVEGLAPYWFEVEAHGFLSTKGDLLGRLAASYDQRITQRLILQPRAEFNLAAQDVPESGIGAGLSDAEFDLRLRYEFVREFAPYVGLSYSAKTGRSADFARAVGEDPTTFNLVLGVRAWF